jgi:hypothetical protein
VGVFLEPKRKCCVASSLYHQLCNQYVERCLELSKNQAIEALGQRDDQTKRDFMRVQENTVKCSQRVSKAGFFLKPFSMSNWMFL